MNFVFFFFSQISSPHATGGSKWNLNPHPQGILKASSWISLKLAVVVHDPERGNRNIFGHTQEPHLKNFLLRQPQVKMSMQIAVKFVELIHASNRINHLNYPMAFPVLSASQ